MNINSFATIPQDINYCYEYAKHWISGKDMPDEQQGSYALCGHVRLLSACGIILTIAQFAMALLTGQMTKHNFFVSAALCIKLHDAYVMSDNFINYHPDFIKEYDREIKERIEEEKEFYLSKTIAGVKLHTHQSAERLARLQVDRGLSAVLMNKLIITIFQSTIFKAIIDGAGTFMDGAESFMNRAQQAFTDFIE